MNMKSNNFHGINHLQYLLAKKIDGMDFNSERIMYTVLERAMKGSKMLAATGREGMAKTTGIASYVLTKPNSYYINIGQSYSPKHFFKEMISVVSKGKEKPQSDMYTMMRQLANLLTEDESRKLVCVDDAGKLSPRGLGLFHELRDKTMHCTGFVFCGVSYFRTQLEKSIKRGVPGVAEFYRRIQGWVEIPNIQSNEIAEYCSIRKLTADEIQTVKKAKPETVAALEILVDKIIDLRKPEK
jgi:DNA transposition AAA+ family ATPase